MSIRLWPQEYEKKNHITGDEKFLLRRAARNFHSGHIVVGIDPVVQSVLTVRTAKR